jgi:hypothetical protein
MPAKSSRKPIANRETRPRGRGRAWLARPALIAIVALLVGVALLYPEIVFQGKVFVSEDSRSATSFAAVGNRSLAQGDYPVWNPYLFCGMPSFGSMAYVPWVYPVNWILKPFRHVLPLPEYTWLLFHTVMTGLGVFLLLRDRGVRAAAAIPAGVLMMWVPNLVAVGAYGHGSQACAVAYLPFALWLWDRIWRGRNVIVNATALALVLGFSMLRGHLQVSYYTYALVVLHVIFFGALALVDASRHRRATTSPLPARLAARVQGDSSEWSRAFGELGFSVATFAVVVAISLLLCAVLYLPVHDYARYSIRGASAAGGLSYQYATGWSLHPSEMLTFIVPFSFGFGKDLYLGHMPFTDYPNYLGVVVLAFAVVAVVRVRDRWVGFLAFVAVVATLVSFGKFFPVLYGPLFKLAPYFSKFRVPVMVLIVQQLAVILLFGVGLDQVMKSQRAGARRWALRALIVAGALFVVAILSQGYWTDGFATGAASRVRVTDDPSARVTVARMAGEFLASDLVQLGILALLAAAATFAFVSSTRMRPAVFALIVLALGIADYYRVDRFILHPERFRNYEAYRIIREKPATDPYTAADEMMTFLREREGIFRVFPIDDVRNPINSGAFMSNRYMVFGIESVGGYHPAKLSAYDEFLAALAQSVRDGRFHLLNMVNARYFVSGVRLPEHPALTALWGGADFEGNPRAIYENKDAFPRAWVVGDYTVATGDQSLGMLAGGAIDLRRSVILSEEPAIKPEPGDSAVVSIVREHDKALSLSVTLDRPGIVVISDAYYPEWKATVDGVPATIIRANHAFRALALEAGAHEIEMHYEAALLRKGATISITTFVLTILALVGAWWAGRRTRPPKDTAWKPSS